MALKRNGNQPPTLAQLQAQRQDLAQRLAALAGAAARLDPVNDWQVLATQLAEQTALERAISTLDERIEAARLAERAANRDALDAERAARAVAARANLDAAARAYVDALQALPAAQLAAARHELAQVAGWPGPAAGAAIDAARQIDGLFVRLKMAAPEWLGLPSPPSPAAQALAERKAAVERAERLLEDCRKVQREQRHGGPSVSQSLLENYAHGLAGARAGLLRLTEPDLSDHDVTVKSSSGIRELAGWLGDYLEKYNDAQRLAQAQQSPAMA